MTPAMIRPVFAFAAASLVMVTSRVSVIEPEMVAVVSLFLVAPAPVMAVIGPGNVTFTVISPIEPPPSRPAIGSADAPASGASDPSFFIWKTMDSPSLVIVHGPVSSVNSASANVHA